MKVSIIIVNYNTSQLVGDCIRTILSSTIIVRFEIIVVDNNSPQRDIEKLGSEFPMVKFIFHSENAGFGAANNLGRKYASGQFLFFLNPDTLLLNNAVKEFYDFYQSHQKDLKIGALGATLRNADGEENASFSSKFINFEQEIFAGVAQHFNQKKEKQTLDDGVLFKEVAWVSGADLFINANVFDEVGGFDENIFMYYEETDLQRRLKEKGYKNMVLSTPQIIHLEGGSFQGKISIGKKKIIDKSKFYYYRKYTDSSLKFSLLKNLYFLLTAIKFFPQFGLSGMRDYLRHVSK